MPTVSEYCVADRSNAVQGPRRAHLYPPPPCGSRVVSACTHQKHSSSYNCGLALRIGNGKSGDHQSEPAQPNRQEQAPSGARGHGHLAAWNQSPPGSVCRHFCQQRSQELQQQTDIKQRRRINAGDRRHQIGNPQKFPPSEGTWPHELAAITAAGKRHKPQKSQPGVAAKNPKTAQLAEWSARPVGGDIATALPLSPHGTHCRITATHPRPAAQACRKCASHV